MQAKQYLCAGGLAGFLWCLIIGYSIAGEPIQSTATPIFVAGTTLSSKYNRFRIPSISRTSNGTLIAICEAWTKEEAGYKGDPQYSDPGDPQYTGNGYADRSDIVMRRSTDGGATWTPAEVLVSDESIILPTDTRWRAMYSNPTQVVDMSSNTIFLHYNQWLNGKGAGDATKNTTDNMAFVISSTDNGVTWTSPVNIVGFVKDYPNWNAMAYGPGSGIQLPSGRLLVPAARTSGHGFEVYAVYSDDHGLTWHRGEIAETVDLDLDGASDTGNENQIVALNDGNIYLQARPNAGINSTNSKQIILKSYNGGIDWPATAITYGMSVPQVQTAIERYTLQSSGDDMNRLVWTGPLDYSDNGTPHRLSIKVSRSEGHTFETTRPLWDGAAWYSNATVDPNKNFVGLLFESDHSQDQYVTPDSIYFTAVNRAYLEPPTGLISWDPFNYNANAVSFTADGTKDGGLGWTTPWHNDIALSPTGGLPPEIIENSDLFYGGQYRFTNQGNRRLFLRPKGYASPPYLLSRAFAPMIDLGQTRSYFVSMVVRADTLAYGQNLDVKLYGGITSGLGFGIKGGSLKVYVDGGSGVAEKSVGLLKSSPFFLVFKIAAVGNPSTVEYIYAKAFHHNQPVPLSETAATGFNGWDVATASSVSTNMQIDRIVISAGTESSYLIDDLRVGTTWEAVVSNQE